MKSTLDRAERALRDGDAEAARRHLEALLRTRPDEPRAVALLARALIASGRAAEALRATESLAMRGLDPIDLARAEALLAVGRHEDAVTAATQLVARAPTLAHARRALASALYRHGDPLGALREARVAVDLAPDDAASRAQLGAALLALGRLRDARRELEHALAMDPSGLGARNTLAQALLVDGRTHDALETLAPLAHGAHGQDARALARSAELLDGIDDPRAVVLREAIRARASVPVSRGESRRGQRRTASRSEAPLLERAGRDLVDLARRGLLDPVWGRDAEIDRVIDVLLRRRKSNPVLVGPAGVGKTAIVEGLGHRIAAGRVPDRLREARVVELPIAQLVAGSSFRGELEQRMLAMLDALRDDPHAIVFLDEIHTLASAGTSSGESGGVADVLKPALARGEIAVIGATTDDGFDRVLSRDPALARRFARVEVAEPTPEQTAPMLRAAADDLGRFHGVRYDDAALDAAVTLSTQLLAERRLPDKAIDVIDQAAVRATRDGRSEVTVDDVRAVLADLARVPLERVGAARADTGAARLASLAATLRGHVRGQDDACERIAEVLLVRSMALATTGDRPRGVFLFAGPPGVGKSAMARSLARALHDGDERMVRLDMTEFAERHEVARLLGAPAGYVGHEHAGLLARALRERPSALVLLDDVDRAHADVLDVFLQLFDGGRATDAHGDPVDARQATFVLTVTTRDSSRIVPGFAVAAADGPGEARNRRERQAADALRERLRPELLARVDATLVFEPLDARALGQMVRSSLESAALQLRAQGIALRFDDGVCDALAREAEREGQGGRAVARAVERGVLLPAARLALVHGGRVALRATAVDGRVTVARDDEPPPG